MPSKKTKNKSIFVSSTFRDMQSERDALRDFVLPRVNEFAAKYGRAVEMRDTKDKSMSQIVGRNSFCHEKNKNLHSVSHSGAAGGPRRDRELFPSAERLLLGRGGF